ncbi:hypothetical protein [Blastopirellula retiformator]|uniref:Uncharacterized protein n=1 Tax=Blastopirellula retiformator TaxID=2527970 RepID=A0A5C5UX02_9BACT|nr:hypothetical protein [Blastopirellula retiformator]TWT30718.1 hypothetical protein Enr8_42410 [Blastopirellula retiformator]
MSEQFFIDDGYDQEGFIAQVAGVHGPIEFTYRPMIQADRQSHYDLVIKKKLPADRAMAKTVSKHLQSWSLERDPTPENLAKLRSPILEKLHAIISGEAPSEAGEGDGLTSAEQDEDDVKNSGSASP